MTFEMFMSEWGWAVASVIMTLVSYAVIYLIYRKGLSKHLEPLEDKKEAYTKMWITLALVAVISLVGYYFTSWAFDATIMWIWYLVGSLVGGVLAIVGEFKRTGIKLEDIKSASSQITADMQGVRSVTQKAGIVDEAKFNSIMASVNSEIKAKLEEIEKAKDEKHVKALKEALIAYLVEDGKLDETEKEILKAGGVTDNDLKNSEVMFNFLNNK